MPASAAALTAHPLLHLETRPDAWERWMTAQGVVAPMARGMIFDQFATMTQAAIHGLGIALLPTYLAERELAEGRLVVAFGTKLRSVGSYYLVWPKNRPGRQPLLSFRAWLAGQVATAAPLPAI